jgi:hypothetical protein
MEKYGIVEEALEGEFIVGVGGGGHVLWRSRVRFTLGLRIAAVEEGFLGQKTPSE